MFEPILFKSFIALILIAISCSLLGVFVLWKKLSYFGDSFSHSILLGLIIGGFFNYNQIISLILFALFFCFLLNFSLNNSIFSKDTIIAVFSYFFISIAVIINDISEQNFNFISFIFGDILTTNNQDLLALTIIFIITLFFTIFATKKLLLININSDLAKISGINCNGWNLFFLILLAIAIALSVRIVGIFLMTALLILPAAIARIFSTSPKSMIVYSTLIGLISSCLSFPIANQYNLTISSVLIALLAIVFMIIFVYKKYGKL